MLLQTKQFDFGHQTWLSFIYSTSFTIKEQTVINHEPLTNTDAWRYAMMRDFVPIIFEPIKAWTSEKKSGTHPCKRVNFQKLPPCYKLCNQPWIWLLVLRQGHSGRGVWSEKADADEWRLENIKGTRYQTSSKTMCESCLFMAHGTNIFISVNTAVCHTHFLFQALRVDLAS